MFRTLTVLEMLWKIQQFQQTFSNSLSHLKSVSGQSGRLQLHPAEPPIHLHACIHPTWRTGLVSYVKTNNLLEHFISLKTWLEKKKNWLCICGISRSVKRDPKPAPGFDGSLEGLKGQHTVIVTSWFQWQDKSKISKEQKEMGWSLGKTTHELPRVLSQRSRTGHATSCDNMENITNQESSYQIRCPGFLVGTGQVDTLA